MITHNLIKLLFASLLVTLSCAIATADPSEDDSQPTNMRPNLISQSRVEFVGGASSGGTKLGINYIVSPKFLIGLFGQNLNELSSSEGGDLDNGQYYKTTSGFSAKALLIATKYFLNEKGIESKGWFVSGQLGRVWGKYEFSQDRYERDNGFVGGTFFGIDKKIAESSSVYKTADTEVVRASVGYSIPWIDGNLLKGISLQIHGGLEINSLPENQYLTNKFGTRNVGEDVKKTFFGEIALGAYF